MNLYPFSFDKMNPPVGYKGSQYTPVAYPNSSTEGWQYLKLKELFDTKFSTLQNLDIELLEAGKIRRHYLGDALNIVFVDGIYVPEFSDKLEENGITLTTVENQLQHSPESLTIFLQDTKQEDAFYLSNLSHLHSGIYLQAQANKKADRPIHFLHVYIHPEITSFVRHFIHLESTSSVELIHSHISEGNIPHYSNAVCQIKLETEASLTQHHIHSSQENSHFIHQDHGALAQGASLNDHGFYGEGGTHRKQMKYKLQGDSAKVSLDGLFLGKNNDQIDLDIAIDHAHFNTHSSQSYKGIMNGKGKGIFSGTVNVLEGAHSSTSAQINKNLLLSRDAQIVSCPRLQIDNEDVKCTHGSTTGQLNKEELFYFMSRGIPEQEAKNLLIKGFAQSELFKNPNKMVVERSEMWLEKYFK